jgi:hypothetical protein
LVLAIIAVLAFWIWREGRERRALSALPAQDRAELYHREFETLRTLCGHGPREDALQQQCKARAEFLLQFPECDASCRELARSHLPTATR